MITWKQTPQDPFIARYIEAYWFIHKAADDDTHPYPKLYPDVSAHLILGFNNYKCEYLANKQKQVANGCHCILPHSATFTMDHTKGFTILGVKIHPGMHNVLNALITQNCLNGIALLREQLLNHTDIERWLSLSHATADTVRELDNWLTRIIDGTSPTKNQRLVQHAISLLPDTACSDLGRQLGTSQRTLERHFQQQTLMTMKQFQSACRAEKLLEYLFTQRSRQPDWADISAHFGFADQPHLIRELKQIIGTTPTSYWQDKDLTIDVYGDFHTNT